MKNIHKREYFMIRVCTGYSEVGYSPPPIYYELLLVGIPYMVVQYLPVSDIMMVAR